MKLIETIDIQGPARERGRQFGALRRESIQACLEDWLGSLRTGGVADTERYLQQFLQSTDFLSDIRKHAPDLLEEVDGIAAGSEQPIELVLAAQFMDEEWAFRRSFLSAPAPTEKCSSAAIHLREGLTWIGQNMDLGGYTDGHQLALRIAPEGSQPGAVIFTIGPMIALMGVNSHGVGVFVNSLPQLPSAPKGMPVAFVIRKLLQARTATQAAQWVQALPHASGQHYLLGDPYGIRSFEASSTSVLEYRSPDPSRVLHTNHPLCEDKGVSIGSQVNSETRLRSLTTRLMSGTPDSQALKAALSAFDDPEHPVCRLPNPDGRASPVTGMIGFTTGSMVSELKAGERTIPSWLSNGPPVRGYSQVDLPTS